VSAWGHILVRRSVEKWERMKLVLLGYMMNKKRWIDRYQDDDYGIGYDVQRPRQIDAVGTRSGDKK